MTRFFGILVLTLALLSSLSSVQAAGKSRSTGSSLALDEVAFNYGK